jgi:hypothetical protein
MLFAEPVRAEARAPTATISLKGYCAVANTIATGPDASAWLGCMSHGRSSVLHVSARGRVLRRYALPSPAHGGGGADVIFRIVPGSSITWVLEGHQVVRLSASKILGRRATTASGLYDSSFDADLGRDDSFWYSEPRTRGADGDHTYVLRRIDADGSSQAFPVSAAPAEAPRYGQLGVYFKNGLPVGSPGRRPLPEVQRTVPTTVAGTSFVTFDAKRNLVFTDATGGVQQISPTQARAPYADGLLGWPDGSVWSLHSGAPSRIEPGEKTRRIARDNFGGMQRDLDGKGWAFLGPNLSKRRGTIYRLTSSTEKPTPWTSLPSAVTGIEAMSASDRNVIWLAAVSPGNSKACSCERDRRVLMRFAKP